MGDQAVPAGQSVLSLKGGIQMLRLQSRSPSATATATADELTGDDRSRQGRAGVPALRAGPPLPARRRHALGRRPGRLLRAVPHGGRGRPRPSSSSSAACTSWPNRPTCSPAPTSRCSCPTSTPAAPWPTWPTSTRWRRPGRSWPGSPTSSRVIPITYMNSSAALKAFVGRHEGAVCTSSNARAVLTWALEAGPGRQGPVLPRPAPGPQHRLPARLRRRRHAGLEPAPGPRGAERRRGQGVDAAAVEGPLLGPPALPARARDRLPGRASRTGSSWSTPSAPTTWWRWPTWWARPTT